MAASRQFLLLLVSCVAALLDGGAGGSPAVPQLSKAVQCLSLNRTALLQEPGYNCVKLLDWFADVYTGLVGCFLENAHPTCMCEACLPFYREVHKIYSAIRTYDSKQNSTARYYVAGHRCTENLLYGSRVGVLQSALAFADNLWQTAACECCIRNGTTANDSTVLTPEALEFYRHLENLTKCTGEYAVIAEDLHNASPSPVMESPVTLPLPQAVPSNLTNMSVCSACNVQYQQLVQYYIQYKKDVESQGCSVCADIEDHINKTRLQWSAIYGCGRVSVSVVTVIVLALAVMSLPLFFYVGAFLCGTAVEFKEKRQSRPPPSSSQLTDGVQTSIRGSSRTPSYGATAAESPRLYHRVNASGLGD